MRRNFLSFCTGKMSDTVSNKKLDKRPYFYIILFLQGLQFRFEDINLIIFRRIKIIRD